MGRVGHVTRRQVPGLEERPAEAAAQQAPAESVSARWQGLVLRHPYRVVAAVAVLTRVAAVILLGPLQEGVAVPDEIQYIELADSVAAGRGAEAWFPGYGQRLYDTTATFMRPLAVLTWLFGSHQIVGQVLAAAAGVVAALLTTAVASHVVRRGPAVLAGLLAAVLPSQIFWSSVVLRESMVWAFLALLAWTFGRAGATTTWKALVVWGAVAFGCLYALGDLRPLTAVLAGFCLVLTAVSVGGALPRWRVFVVALGVSLTAPLLTGLGPFGYLYVEGAAPQLAVIRANLSAGAASSIVESTPLVPTPSAAPSATVPTPGSTAGPRPGSTAGPRPGSTAGPTPDRSATPQPDRIVVTTPSGETIAVEGEQTKAFANFPQGLVAVTLRPFPWEPAANAGVLLAKLENIAWAALYGFALLGLITSWQSRLWTFFPASFTVLILATAAVTQGNLGTAFRHRGQVLWALAILSVAGLQWLWDRRRARQS